jgi:NAD(P)H-quinone oxidoreductase subunit 5
MSLYLLSLVSPLALIIGAGFAFSRPGRRPAYVALALECAALSACLAAVVSTIWLVIAGPQSTHLFGSDSFGFAVRLDVISATMLVLVAGIGWVVLRYSATYIDGEDRQGAFMAWLAATLATVLFLVQAGDLTSFAVAWIATSLCLQRLLLFYPHRVQARRAARKKFVVARISDIALVAAVILLGLGYGTTDIETILRRAGAGQAPISAIIAAGLFALAALLKSAQFPTHGWLTEVMEAPTPVSALLHAGVINAGGFLLIRFADVMLLAPGVLAALVMVGGFSALFGGLAMLAQPSVKTSLAWSTIAQMGFMMMQCGLALFPLALLHIVAHSLYKAHAFLSSGDAVSTVAAARRPGAVAIPGARAVRRAFALALAIYVVIAFSFGLDGKSPQALALGAILIFGVAYLIAQGLADTAPRALTQRTAAYAVAASVSYFLLQTFAEWLTAGALPPTPAPGPLEWALLVLAIFSFGLVAIAQATFPLWATHPAAAGLRVHLSNGLYANAVFDRLIGNWSARRSN